MVLGCRAFGKRLGYKNRVLLSRIIALMKETPKNSLYPGILSIV
jgi:hypothetical protein